MTRSTTLSPLSAVEADGDLTAAVRQRLVWFCRHPAMHMRFLNTLSLMEHIGSRKIMASQAGQRLSGDTLRHLAEETRHAYFFKHAGEKIARHPLDYDAAELIAPAAARAYMGRLDAGIARDFGAIGPLPYLYMSLIVELRAVWFYRLYQETLTDQGSPLSLRSVLAEEELHLSAMQSQLTAMDTDYASRLARFRVLEHQRFSALWSSVEAACGRVLLAAE